MQQDGLWQAVLGEVELSVSKGSYLTWFKNTELLHNDHNLTIIGVQNVFIQQQLQKKFNNLIATILTKKGFPSRRIEYQIITSTTQRMIYDEPVFIEKQEETKNEPQHTTKNGFSHSYRQGLNEKYTLDNFVVGAGNELAFAACQSIAANPGSKYNPLFIYGGVGIGKTHLIQAVGNALKNQNSEINILYISTEQFVQEFVESLRSRKTADFASYYRSADVLIVDDIQFIAGKEKIQEEFFHTFNALHQANKQIIISSDKPPKDIPTLEERLRSRFTWGMSIDMQTPDFETRCAIIKTKSLAHNVELSPDIIEFLSNNIPTNIRELEGALNQLLAFCEMRAIEPSLGVATSLLGSSKSRPKHLSAHQVVDRVSKYYQVPVDDMLGPKRDKDIVVARQSAMYLLRSELHLSFPKISRELKRKDHTTAMHSVNKIEKQLNLDSDLKQSLAAIKERLYA
jgi:chromosomal replication initiator protein